MMGHEIVLILSLFALSVLYGRSHLWMSGLSAGGGLACLTLWVSLQAMTCAPVVSP